MPTESPSVDSDVGAVVGELRRAWLAGAGLAGFVVALSVWALPWPLLTITLLSAVAGLVTIVATVSYWRLTTRPLPPRNQPPVPASTLTVDTTARLGSAQASMLALFVVAPDVVVTRLAEHIQPRTRAFVFSATRTYVPMPSLTYLPLLMSPKGLLHDRMEVRASGDALAVLSHEESAQLSLAVIRQLLSCRCTPDQMAWYQAKVEAEVASIIMSRARPTEEGHPGRDESVSRVTAQLDELCRSAEVVRKEPDPETSAAFDLACQMITRLTDNYLLVGELPESGDTPRVRPVITIEEFVIPFLGRNPPKPWIARIQFHFIDWIRRAFGVRPTRFIVDLSPARTAASYHLNLMGPEGTYLARHRTVGFDQAEIRASGAYIRFRRRHGQRYAHIYGRGGRSIKTASGQMRADLTFFERPPGSFATTAISAAVLTWFIALAGHFVANVDVWGPASPGADAAAVMLALPGIVAAWFGFEDANRLLGGSLVSRMLSALVAALAVISAGCVVGNVEWQTDVRLFDLDTLWTLLAIASMTLTAAAVYSFLVRAKLYRDRLAAPPGQIELSLLPANGPWE